MMGKLLSRSTEMPADGLAAQMAGWRLATAEVIYHIPDHPHLLQTFVWQTYDLAPKFPRIHDFLSYWQKEIIGRLHSVRISACTLITPGEWTKVDVRYEMN